MTGSTPRKGRGHHHNPNNQNQHHNHNYGSNQGQQQQQYGHTRNRSSHHYNAHIAQGAVSDYESDGLTAPYYTNNQAPPPPSVTMANRTNTDINLSVIRRYRPNISVIHAVIHNARPHVLEMKEADGQITTSWRMLENVEGPLFICSQPRLQDVAAAASASAQPVEDYFLIIMNRKGMQNFILEFAHANHFETSNDFFMFGMDDKIATEDDTTPMTMNAKSDNVGKVIGLWTFFDDPKERAETEAKLQDLWNRHHPGLAA